MTDDNSPASMPAEALNRADAALVATLDAVVSVHANESHWWNNASFALPLLGCIVLVTVGWIAGIDEAFGFGLFLGVVALLMTPVVLVGWRGVATAIVLTRDRALALHDGHVMREFPWAEVVAIDRAETMGNIRWRIHSSDGQHLAIDGEIADVEGLVAQARTLAALPAPAPTDAGAPG